MPHPGGHNRVPAGYRQPGQRIGQPPAVAGRIRQDFLQYRMALGETGRACEPVSNRSIGIDVGGPGCSSYDRKKSIKADPGIVRAGQPVPGGQQIGGRLPQRFLLVAENVQAEAGVQFRVVDAPAFELSVLIVLDQMVIGMAGESQGIEPQGIHRRQAQQSQVGFRRAQMGQVECDQIMAQQVICALGECVQVFQGRAQVAAVKRQGLAALRPHRAKGMDAIVVPSDFQVQGKEIMRVNCCPGHPGKNRLSEASEQR